MLVQIESIEEAIVAAAHERVARKLFNESWLDMTTRYMASPDPELDRKMRQVMKTIADEVIEYCGDKVAKEVGAGIH